jgi:hypothetical protein
MSIPLTVKQDDIRYVHERRLLHVRPRWRFLRKLGVHSLHGVLCSALKV